MNSKLKIKNIIFDIGGVIILRRKFNFSKFDRKLFLPKGTTKKTIDLIFKKSMLNRNFDIENFFRDNPQLPLTLKQYKGITKEFYGEEKINRVLVNWLRGKNKNYKVFLLTNNTIELNNLLKERFQIFDIFNYIFNSAEIGLAKPDPKFFEYILKKLKTKPEECLFVDNKKENIEVAKQLGFYTILFKNNKKFFEKTTKINI